MGRVRVIRCVGGVALVACSAIAAHAQELRGTVRDSASGGVIPGAVLLLRDASGATIGRNITNDLGAFRLADIAGVRSLQVLRIGFRPRVVAVTDAERAAHTIDITMLRVPQLLDVFEVNDQPACPRRADRPKAFALWEQARAALLATVVAREANPAYAEALEFQRTMDPKSDTIVSQTVRIQTGRTTRPFVAAKPARVFIDSGFATTESEARTFFGPDADVMLDEAFARAYCFQVERAPADRANEIGLAFAPAHHGDGHVDVEGTLWIDTVARALTHLDFRYVGVSSRERDLRAGGLVSFRTMPTGVPIIDRWYLRLIAFRDPGGPWTRNPVQVAVPEEGGGEVAHARWNSGLEWNDSLGTLRGTVTAFDKPVSGAALILAGTDYRAKTDSLGRFEISDLLPGPYEVVVDDPMLVDLGLELTNGDRFRAARDSVVHLAVTMPTVDEMIRKRCSDIRRPGPNNLIAGRVRNPDGSPAAHVSLLMRLAGPIDTPPSETVSSIDPRRALGQVAETILDAKTGADGRFYLCKVPVQSELLLIVQSPAGAAAARVMTWGPDQRFFPVLLKMQPATP